MDYLLEFMSAAISLSLVALGLQLVQRSHGIVILEIIPLSTGLSLCLLSSFRIASPATLDNSTLIVPGVTLAVGIWLLQPRYAKWRLRVAGESTTLLLSFALMSCAFSAMSLSTSNRAVSLALADTSMFRTKSRLEFIIVVLGAIVLLSTLLYLRRRRLTAALQLSKDDHRLLATFGLRSDQVRRHILIVAVVICTAGVVLFAALQETFAVSNYDAVLIPGFAIAISQSRISLWRVIAVAFLLIAVERLVTQWTTELLLDAYRALLFSVFVLVAITSRFATERGLIVKWRRQSLAAFRGRFDAIQP